MARTSLHSNRFACILHALFLFKFSVCSFEFSTLWKEDFLFYFNRLPDTGSLWGILFGDSFSALVFLFPPSGKAFFFNGRMSYFLACKQTLALNYCLVQQIAAIHRFKIRFKSKTQRYFSCKTLTVSLDLNHCLPGLDSKPTIFLRGVFISVYWAPWLCS